MVLDGRCRGFGLCPKSQELILFLASSKSISGEAKVEAGLYSSYLPPQTTNTRIYILV
jgi:hypothetical protein